MKKIVLFAWIALAIQFLSCSSDKSEKFVGVWVQASNGIERPYVLAVNKSGSNFTIQIIANEFDAGKEYPATYDKDKDKLINSQGGEIFYKPESNTLLTSDGIELRKQTISDARTGKYYQGGIIFSMESSGQHGLIVATKDQGIVDILGDIKWPDAKKACQEYRGGGFTDWRLPTKEELNMLCNAFRGSEQGNFDTEFYWSSTEDDKNEKLAWAQRFQNCLQNTHNKNGGNGGKARAIRSF